MSEEAITIKDVVDAISRISQVIQLNESYLNQLDAVVGDGEHGFNLNRAFQRVSEKLPELPQNQARALLKGVGRELIAAGGGAGTTFYGTAFIAAGNSAGDVTSIDGNVLGEMLSAGIKDIRDRGHANLGDKTMVDALQPAVDAFIDANKAGQSISSSFAAAVKAARQGAIATKEMVGKKGRSLYSSERGLGTPDPGATSAYLVITGLAGVEGNTPL